MNKKTKKIVCALVLSIVLLAVFAEISQAARWQYHAWRRGWVTVWGTRNCRRVTRPLVYRRPVWRCRTLSGYLPWYCNDWLVRHEWGYPCYNITWRKYVARPCPRSCWRKRWIMGPLDDYFVDYMPYRYARSEIMMPSLGDPNGHLTGNRGIYIFADLGVWMDALDSGSASYTPLGDGGDPNTRSYHFTDGNSPDLPGFLVLRLDDPNMSVEQVSDLITFNPDADPCDYPFVNNRPDLLFSGELRLLSEDSFTSEEYNGYLMAGDGNRDGTVNYLDFAQTADIWLDDVNTAGPLE
ncbi:MAG: hypothetical protein KKE31_00835 [Planctomycetes bacterium]|nr:hypothetical protein [Planctomycetota bacterium]MBU1517652.1 hypothetical protein [Planctomycetota bacterium]MBU2457167.1 hypothetical protein [Planctomycetota bacterium]